MMALKDGKLVKLEYYVDEAGFLVLATPEEGEEKGYKPWNRSRYSKEPVSPIIDEE